jgi:hypothetical protein
MNLVDWQMSIISLQHDVLLRNPEYHNVQSRLFIFGTRRRGNGIWRGGLRLLTRVPVMMMMMRGMVVER